jgi:hypothetical protein
MLHDVAGVKQHPGASLLFCRVSRRGSTSTSHRNGSSICSEQSGVHDRFVLDAHRRADRMEIL